MDYHFETDSWGASFSFPWAAVGGHIKKCSEAQIKILLCILAGPAFTSSAVISDMSGYSETDVDEAVSYWSSLGVLRTNGAAPVCALQPDDTTHVFSGKNEPVSLVEAVRPTKTIAVDKKVTVKYTQREMQQKAENDADLKALINEIQTLQFSINGSELAKLIELYEYYKFDAPSIMLAADYCRSAGKCSIAYLYTVMVNWYNEGIHSYSDVEGAMIKAAERKAFENKIMRLFGMESKPSKKQRAYIEEWEKLGYNNELIEIAYNKCLDSKGKLSFSYIDGILKKWAGGGITTPEQVEESDKEFRSRRTYEAEDKSSYDLDEYESFANNFDFGDVPWNKGKDD